MRKKPLLFAAITGIFTFIVAEWLVTTAIVVIPRIKSFSSPDQVNEYLLSPFYVFRLSMQTENFLEIQLFIGLITLGIAGWIYLKSDTGAYKGASEYGAFGTARFAVRKEVFTGRTFAKKTTNKPGLQNLENPPGLIFGLFNNKPVILPEETEIPNRNVFVVGSPGSGKTQSFILTNIIHDRERSIVVTDPKGEIYEASAELKRQQGYEVRLVNFKEMMISDRYNPIDYITKEIEAEQVATTIVLNSGGENNKQDFWSRAEVALLKTLLLYVKYEFPHNATMVKVKDILTDYGANPKKIEATFNTLGPDHPAFQAYQIVRMAEERVRASISISLGVTLSKFDASDVRRFVEVSDFRLDEIGKKKMIVYCILPVADSTWEPLISTFFTQMFQRLYDVADKNFNRLPVKVNLLLDEFPNLGKIPGYEEILATCRSYGISSSTIVQSLGQIIDKYTKDKAEAIVGNCSLRCLLGVGDKLTAEYFSELVGKTTIQTMSTSASKNTKGGSDSMSQSYSARNLMTADELTRMHRNETVLLVSGTHPIKLKKAYQFSFFKDVLNDSNKTSRFDYLKIEEEPV